MTQIKKLIRKNQTLLLTVALIFLGLTIFVPAKLKDRKPDIKSTAVLSTLELVPMPDSRKEVNVPILMYHHIRQLEDQQDPIGTNLSVSPELFQQEINWLKDNNYTTISFADLNSFPAKSLPEKPVIITFDDGYSDAYTNAYGYLKINGQLGVFYIITGKINLDGYLTENQIIELDNAGMEIGSHTISHPDLTVISPDWRLRELVESKSTLEKILGKTINSFCYPSGDDNLEAGDAVKSAEYLDATTTAQGIATTANDKFFLPRLRMQHSDTINKFIQKLSNV